MPWLEGEKLLKVAQSNSTIRFCIRIILVIQDQPPTAFLLEHPENLGSVRGRPSATVRPASIWELAEIQKLQVGQTFTVAFFQCRFGAKFPKPTRLLTNLQHLQFFRSHLWPHGSSGTKLWADTLRHYQAFRRRCILHIAGGSLPRANGFRDCHRPMEARSPNLTLVS